MSQLHPAFSAMVFPGNETKEHFLLKQVGLIWLKMKGCHWVGTEVWGLGGRTKADEARGKDKEWYRKQKSAYVQAHGYRVVADVAGVAKESTGQGYRYTVHSIEVKVSRADFQAGYCTGANLAYVMTPKGLIRPDELETNVGLLEVDLQKLRPHKETKHIASCVRVVKKPRRQTIPVNRAMRIIQDIGASYTNQAVFKNPWLILP